MSESAWEKVALKYVATLYNGNSIKDEDKGRYSDPDDAVPYIATKDIAAEGQLVDYENGMYVKCFDSSFSRAHAGDTLICLEGGSAGRKIAYLNRDVAFVNKLCCLHPHGVDSVFLYYAMQTNEFKDEFYSSMTGLIGGVSVGALGSVKIPLPAPNEQQNIACYLSVRTRQIDKLIKLTEKAINLDEEEIQSEISRTVTTGLNPEAPLVDSGVKWIGDIPNTWKRSRIAWIRRRPTAYGIIKLGEEPEADGIPVLRCSDVRNGYIDFSGVRTVGEELSNEFSRTLLNGGEVLINVRGTLGGCAVVPDKCAGWNIAREVAMIDVSPRFDSRYVKYFLMGERFWSYLNSNLAGSVYQGLNIEMLEHAEIVIPPIEEQVAIADYLDQRFSRFRNLVAKKQKLLDGLREYRAAIISESINGRLKVSSV